MAMTFTYDDGANPHGGRRVVKVIAAWTSSAGGSASGTTDKISGRLVKAVTVPIDGPTDNYDITLSGEDGEDLLGKCKTSLINRDTTNAEEQYFLVLNEDTAPLSMAVHPLVCGEITITVAAAGNAKSGTLTLYLEQ